MPARVVYACGELRRPRCPTVGKRPANKTRASSRLPRSGTNPHGATTDATRPPTEGQPVDGIGGSARRNAPRVRVACGNPRGTSTALAGMRGSFKTGTRPDHSVHVGGAPRNDRDAHQPPFPLQRCLAIHRHLYFNGILRAGLRTESREGIDCTWHLPMFDIRQSGGRHERHLSEADGRA